jgi:hypothetical protein
VTPLRQAMTQICSQVQIGGLQPPRIDSATHNYLTGGRVPCLESLNSRLF